MWLGGGEIVVGGNHPCALTNEGGKPDQAPPKDSRWSLWFSVTRGEDFFGGGKKDTGGGGSFSTNWINDAVTYLHVIYVKLCHDGIFCSCIVRFSG